MPAAIRDSQIQEVEDDDIDYELSSPNSLFGSHVNMIPLQSAVQGPRLFYGARFFNQALPVVGAEVPWVQNAIDNDPEGRSFDDYYGGFAGALRADDDYDVQGIEPDYLTLRRASDGEVVKKSSYNRLPFNRKSYISHRPVVKIGDKITKGGMLAASNFTDDKGTLAMGLNARVGLVPYKGYTMDDAITVSQSFANKLKSASTETVTQQLEDTIKTGRNHFRSLFPEKFTKKQLELVDDDGVVKPGTIVRPGDPLILATKPRVLSSRTGEIGKLSRAMQRVRSDASQIWEGKGEAEVMDVAKTKNGYKVIVKKESTSTDADKIVFRSGQKGTISRIIPDEHMPRTLDGKPLEVLLNPLSLPSRANVSLLYELLMGKVAAAKGAPIKVPGFNKPGENLYDQVEQMLTEAGLTDTEEVFDPMENRKLENPITVGNGYILKLHHTGESKRSARGQGSYDQNEQPAKGGSDGAKRWSGLENHALMSSGAYATLREGATLRGQRNDEYWRELREGNTPKDPGAPFVWKKFRALMSGAGLRMKDEGKGQVRLGPLTDADLDAYKPMEIRNPKLINFKTLEPESGGLFDQGLVGNNRWGTIKLPEPMLNPAFEDVARHLLGLKRKDIEAIMAGDMDLPPELQQRVQRMSKSAFAGAIRAVGAGAKTLGGAMGRGVLKMEGKLIDDPAGAVGRAATRAGVAGGGVLGTSALHDRINKWTTTKPADLGLSPAAVQTDPPPHLAPFVGDYGDDVAYAGHFTPAQFMPNYGAARAEEVSKAKAYQESLGKDGLGLDYDRIDKPIPVLMSEGVGLDGYDKAFLGPHYERQAEAVYFPKEVRRMDYLTSLSNNMGVSAQMDDPDIPGNETLQHEMRHAWQAPAFTRDPGKSPYPAVPGAWGMLSPEVLGARHGLSDVEQYGWLGGLQHELYGATGSRLETPASARQFLEEAISSPRGELLEKYPIKNTEVLRGVDWLRDLRRAGRLDLRARAKYEELLERLSLHAPSLVYSGDPDSQAIKMGSVQPVFFDEELSDVPQERIQRMSKSAFAGAIRAVGAGAKTLGRFGKAVATDKNRGLPALPGALWAGIKKFPSTIAAGTKNQLDPATLLGKVNYGGTAALGVGGVGAGIHRYNKDQTPTAPTESLGVMPSGVSQRTLKDHIVPTSLLWTGDYIGDYTPRQFMAGYGDNVDTEIAKAKSYQGQLPSEEGAFTPPFDYDRIDQPFPVRQIEGFGVLGPRFIPGGANPTAIFPGDGGELDGETLATNLINKHETSVPAISAHEMRHAWQISDTQKKWMQSVIPDDYKKVQKALPEAASHGLSRAEQLGWLGGLQQELYKSRGSRMETPEDARSVLDQLTTDEGAFLQQTPIENTEVLRGTRWLKQVKDLMNSEDPKVREQAQGAYQEVLQWLSNTAPSLVYGGEPDSEAIKMGSVQPVFFDEELADVPQERDWDEELEKWAFTVATQPDYPTTGPAAISAALSAVDLDELEVEHKRRIDSGAVSKRRGSVQALNAIEGLRKNNVKPQQLMITKVPVIPPAFRPFALAGETFIPGDANELYKDLFDMRDAFSEARGVFGDKGVNEERRALQGAVKAVYGYADPVNPKTKQRGVAGFLQQVAGTSPKFSFFQRKLISKPQDQVARGVITPDPELKLDEIGLPESMAWDMYSSYIMRRLVRGGMKRRFALENIKEKSDFARKALLDEMDDRPIVYSRSPAWHKYNIISGKPKLTGGDAIKISPFVTTGLAGDFDGDTMNLHVPASREAVEEARTILKPSSMLFSIKDPDKVVPALKHEQILGPFAASQRKSRGVYQFASKAEALAAIKKGKVSLQDEVEFPDDIVPVKST